MLTKGYFMNKEQALRQINEIHHLIEGNLKQTISGPSMVATGLGIMAIPFIEWFFNGTVDPLLKQVTIKSWMLIFAWRTVFYWVLFWNISRYFSKSEIKNIFVEKIFNIEKIFPIIPVAVSAVLALSGYTNLIAPIVLILVGCLFALFGQFSSFIVSCVAWANIIVGMVGIWLTTYHIDNLWAYLVGYQGLMIMLMGFFLWHNKTADIQD